MYATDLRHKARESCQTSLHRQIGSWCRSPMVYSRLGSWYIGIRIDDMGSQSFCMRPSRIRNFMFGVSSRQRFGFSFWRRPAVDKHQAMKLNARGDCWDKDQLHRGNSTNRIMGGFTLALIIPGCTCWCDIAVTSGDFRCSR